MSISSTSIQSSASHILDTTSKGNMNQAILSCNLLVDLSRIFGAQQRNILCQPALGDLGTGPQKCNIPLCLSVFIVPYPWVFLGSPEVLPRLLAWNVHIYTTVTSRGQSQTFADVGRMLKEDETRLQGGFHGRSMSSCGRCRLQYVTCDQIQAL